MYTLLLILTAASLAYRLQLTDQNQQLIGQNQRLRAGMDPGRGVEPLDLPMQFLLPSETDKLQDEVRGWVVARVQEWQSSLTHPFT